MNRLPTLPSLLLALSLMGTAPARAQVEVAIETSGELRAVLELAGDAGRGRKAFEECAGCHRKDASGRANNATPRLSSQHASVLLKQMMDIRSGKRLNPPMKEYVVDPALKLQDFSDIAAYLQALPVAGRIEPGPGSGVARGKELFARDCSGCHGEQAEGRPELFHPMLANQHYNYLLRELGMIRDGSRGNSNPTMARLVQTYSADDLKAVADYVSQLPPPKP